MIERTYLHRLAIGLALSFALASCQSTDQPSQQIPTILTTVPPETHIPASVQRLAILYPKTADHELRSAYSRLDGAAFQLKAQRPSLKIIDRSDFDAVLTEQRLQMSGMVSDATAVQVGHILGVDSVLIFHIDEPSLRERMMARMSGNLPPVTLTSKIIAVESGEVIYHNVVTAPIANVDQDALFQSIDPNMQAAITRGVLQTITDLEHAFR